MSFGEVEHFGTMLSGCESINSGNALTADGQYAFAVLKVHANDAGLYAGNEGFLDAIKRGANNVYEWIKKMIRAIRDWIRGTKVDQEVRKMEELAKATESPDSQVAAIKRMDVIKVLRQIRDQKDGSVAGNESISIDTIVNEVDNMSVDRRKQVEIYLSKIADTPEFKEVVKDEHDIVVNKALTAIKPRLSELNSLLEKMKETDPDGTVGKELGIEPDRAFSQFNDLLDKIDHVGASTLTTITNGIGRGVIDSNKLLKQATDKLERLNESNKSGGSPIVGKAGRIVNLLSTFTEVGRKLVAQLVAIMERGQQNALTVFISRRWYQARTEFSQIK